MGTASARSRRKNPAINRSSQSYSDSLSNKDYTNAGKIVYWASLTVNGEKGTLDALNRANSFINRSKSRG